MADQKPESSQSVKPFLCIAFAVLNMFAWPCSGKPGKNQVVLNGRLSCETGEIKFFIRKGQEKSFPNLQTAIPTLEDSGITEGGINSLKKVLQTVCTDDWLNSKPIKGVLPERFVSDDRQFQPAPTFSPAPIKSSVFKLTRKGSEVRFSVINLPISDTSDSLVSYIKKAEARSDCWQVTDRPPCFKCPDGTGFCITGAIAR